jgi:ElaB/YqjD/DUF883 family membrane-anchored ribosome-binding protein
MMRENLLQKTEGEIEILRRRAARAKTRVVGALDDAVAKARREVKLGYQKAEDLADDAALRVRRHPFVSVAVSFGAGALAAWLISRRVNGRAPCS